MGSQEDIETYLILMEHLKNLLFLSFATTISKKVTTILEKKFEFIMLSGYIIHTSGV